MKVVMLSATPLACAPWENMKCLNKYGKGRLEVRWIAGKNSYRDGRVFPKDLIWDLNRDEAKKAISEADVIHLQNDLCRWAQLDFRGKPVLAQLHSVPVRPTRKFILDETKHVYTIDQPLQKVAYALPALPNLIDPEEYQPIDRGTKKRIVFAPTNKWQTSVTGSKGYEEVVKILREVEQKYEVVVDIFSNVKYEDNLRRKSLADILIDDVVNSTFHRTTLEGCCFGVAVINNYKSAGWVKADLGSLGFVLEALVKDSDYLESVKRSARNWIETYWHPKDLVEKYMDAYARCLESKSAYI